MEKKVEEKKEKAPPEPNGIIEIVSRVLADNAKVQNEKDESRARIEAAIMTRAAKSTSAIDTTRNSMTAGFKATRDNTIPQTKAVIKA